MAPKQATWFPSHSQTPNLAIQPVFLYHVPRTAGTTLFSVLRHAFETVFAILRAADGDVDLPEVGRYDDPAHNTGSQRNSRPFCLMASHNGFGFHERFANSFHLVTVLRDPVERVASAYTYARMRAGRKPDLGDFEDFVRSPENRDVATRQIVGLEPGRTLPPDAAGQAVDNLESRFFAFTTTANLREIGSMLLTLNGLPNILAEPLNATMPAWRIDTSAHSEMIAAHNRCDVALFDHVVRNPRSRFAELCRDRGLLNPVTTLILDSSDAESAKGEILSARTDDVTKALDLEAPAPADIHALAERLRAGTAPTANG